MPLFLAVWVLLKRLAAGVPENQWRVPFQGQLKAAPCLAKARPHTALATAWRKSTDPGGLRGVGRKSRCSERRPARHRRRGLLRGISSALAQRRDLLFTIPRLPKCTTHGFQGLSEPRQHQPTLGGPSSNPLCKATMTPGSKSGPVFLFELPMARYPPLGCTSNPQPEDLGLGRTLLFI